MLPLVCILFTQGTISEILNEEEWIISLPLYAPTRSAAILKPPYDALSSSTIMS
jgi:hypothetical protein